LKQRYVNYRQVREVGHILEAILRFVAVKLESWLHCTSRANPKWVHNVDVATLVRATRVGAWGNDDEAPLTTGCIAIAKQSSSRCMGSSIFWEPIDKSSLV
jgi:hypothetical protein